MIKIIVEKKECSLYILKDNFNNIYEKEFIFYDVEEPEVNDILYIPESILNEVNIFYYCAVDENNFNKDELIKVVKEDKEYYVQRYYG